MVTPSCMFTPAQTECPAGRFGCSSHLSAADCNGACTAGYYCGPASTTPTQTECPYPSHYCPEGSSQPLPVSLGHYSVVTHQQLCEPGAYCVNGTRHACPAGRFGVSTGETSSQCTAACDDGFFCPSGSANQGDHPCPQGYYCAAGSVVACPVGASW